MIASHARVTLISKEKISYNITYALENRTLFIERPGMTTTHSQYILSVTTNVAPCKICTWYENGPRTLYTEAG